WPYIADFPHGLLPMLVLQPLLVRLRTAEHAFLVLQHEQHALFVFVPRCAFQSRYQSSMAAETLVRGLAYLSSLTLVGVCCYHLFFAPWRIASRCRLSSSQCPIWLGSYSSSGYVS